MSTWYYVDGTERLGPIEENALFELYKEEKIGLETYIWKKGFANWERLKNVTELNFQVSQIEKSLTEIEIPIETKNLSIEIEYENREESIEIIDPFSWHHVNRKSEMFFVKIGTDRSANLSEYFGPYSIVEILDAFSHKRLNERSLIFTLGMDDWQAISAIPFFKDELGFTGLSLPINTKNPIYFVALIKGQKIPFLIKAITGTSSKILTNIDFIDQQEILVSMFNGTKLIKKNILLKVESSYKLEQALNVKLIDINENVKKAIKEFNER